MMVIEIPILQVPAIDYGLMTVPSERRVVPQE
jgi:hypothetical protein